MNILRNPKIVVALVGVLIVWVNGVMGGMIAVLVLDRHDRERSARRVRLVKEARPVAQADPARIPAALPNLPVSSVPGDADRRKAGILAQVGEYPTSRKPAPQAILPVPASRPSVPKRTFVPPDVELPKEGN